jgi:hypothetical protein
LLPYTLGGREEEAGGARKGGREGRAEGRGRDEATGLEKAYRGHRKERGKRL